MKRYLVVLFSVLASAALASDVWERTITSTGTATTAVQLRAGNYVAVCDAAAKMNMGSSSATTVTSSAYAVYLEAARMWPFKVSPHARYVSVISVSGTANCNFSRVLP